MILPIRLIWNLQMKTRQKLSIGGLFCFGWICIIVSTIRVVQLGETENGVPAPSWLALWGTIEASIGMITFPTSRTSMLNHFTHCHYPSCHDRLLPRPLSRPQKCYLALQDVLPV
jgi:hypothetical protein